MRSREVRIAAVCTAMGKKLQEGSVDEISMYLHVNVIQPETILSLKPLEQQGRPMGEQTKNIFVMERLR